MCPSATFFHKRGGRSSEKVRMTMREKPILVGGGKGGVLGEYMKEKQEQGRKEDAANGTRPSVDLTGGG